MLFQVQRPRPQPQVQRLSAASGAMMHDLPPRKLPQPTLFCAGPSHILNCSWNLGPKADIASHLPLPNSNSPAFSLESLQATSVERQSSSYLSIRPFQPLNAPSRFNINRIASPTSSIPVRIYTDPPISTIFRPQKLIHDPIIQYRGYNSNPARSNTSSARWAHAECRHARLSTGES